MTVTLCDKEPFPHEELYLFDNSLKETNIWKPHFMLEMLLAECLGCLILAAEKYHQLAFQIPTQVINIIS